MFEKNLENTLFVNYYNNSNCESLLFISARVKESKTRKESQIKITKKGKNKKKVFGQIKYFAKKINQKVIVICNITFYVSD